MRQRGATKAEMRNGSRRIKIRDEARRSRWRDAVRAEAGERAVARSLRQLCPAASPMSPVMVGSRFRES